MAICFYSRLRVQVGVPESTRSDSEGAVPAPLDRLSPAELERKALVAEVTTGVLSSLTGSLMAEGFQWVLPVVLSKSTDPLWPDAGASLEERLRVEVYGETVLATLSMIEHKMVASSLVAPKLFTLSPNIRIENRERAATGRHAYEFTQLDFESRGATSSDIKRLVELMMLKLVGGMAEQAKEALARVSPDQAAVPLHVPFKEIDRVDLEAQYGRGWEEALPSKIGEPVWVTDMPREFYDFEDLQTGRWDNYDLFLPCCGEVLSGSRREWDHDKMAWKMKRDGVNEGSYTTLLRLAKEGRLRPSAGAGIGVERLVRWLVGARHVGDVQLFPRVPGSVYDL